MKPKRTWVVVADGAAARFFARAEDEARLVQIPDGVLAGERGTASDLEADRPGRSYESATTARHAVEPHTSARDKVEEAFAETVAARLAAAADAGDYERLVVIADPHFLGRLRRVLPARVSERVVAELDRDLTRAPLGQVTETVAGLIQL